ncbi:helix-turn-helix domain-containing protein [Microvirga sp. 0TCS3.31]
MQTYQAPAPGAARSRLLAPSEVAERLSVSDATLKKWRREGSGPAFTKCGDRLVRYSEADVDAFLEAGRSTGHAA